VTEAELTCAPGAIENLVEVAPENAEELWAEFNGFIDSVKHDEIRATVRSRV
jgi:3'-5' exoribonuclease